MIKSEEDAFGQTLDRGIQIFNKLVDEAKAEARDTLSGEDVFKLYDTYGFPLDLTVLMAEEADLKVDESGFEAHMAAQKEKARQATQFKAGHGDDADWQYVTDRDITSFHGYTQYRLDTTIVKYRKSDDEYGIVFFSHSVG